jgi:hypothetical protein
MKTKLLSASLLLLVTITVTIFSCRRETSEIKEPTNGESLSTLSNIALGCYDDQTGDGILKYSVAVTNQFLAILIGNNTQITNSALLKEYDSSTSQYNFSIIADFNDGVESGSLGIGLDVLDDEIIFNAAVEKCVHKCIPSGACSCKIWGISDCNSHECDRVCQAGDEISRCGQSIGPASSINAQAGKNYLDQQTPEC